MLFSSSTNELCRTWCLVDEVVKLVRLMACSAHNHARLHNTYCSLCCWQRNYEFQKSVVYRIIYYGVDQLRCYFGTWTQVYAYTTWWPVTNSSPLLRRIRWRERSWSWQPFANMVEKALHWWESGSGSQVCWALLLLRLVIQISHSLDRAQSWSLVCQNLRPTSIVVWEH